MASLLKFWLPGRVIPKPRPRLSQYGVYLPKEYKAWRHCTRGEMLLQLGEGATIPLITPVGVDITIQGKQPYKMDLDNAAGALLDSLVSAGIIVDDRISCLSRLFVEHCPQGELGAWISVQELYARN